MQGSTSLPSRTQQSLQLSISVTNRAMNDAWRRLLKSRRRCLFLPLPLFVLAVVCSYCCRCLFYVVILSLSLSKGKDPEGLDSPQPPGPSNDPLHRPCCCLFLPSPSPKSRRREPVILSGAQRPGCLSAPGLSLHPPRINSFITQINTATSGPTESPHSDSAHTEQRRIESPLPSALQSPRRSECRLWPRLPYSSTQPQHRQSRAVVRAAIPEAAHR
jgi:hypothetical protein